MYTPDVPSNLLDVANACGAFHELVPTEYIEASEVFFSNPQSHRRFGKIFTKYRVLSLERYERILFLDTDLFIRANIDRLFELQPPAAMARGPDKPPEGTRIRERNPINAGVMLLKPDAGLLQQLLVELTQPRQRLPNYNSPDADYLTEHAAFCGRWSSIPLEYNYQLEFESLDPKRGTVSFSSAREAHFSKEGAAMPFDRLKVIHFSGAKPWSHVLEDIAAMQRLRVEGNTQQALGEKLVEALSEYARDCGELQGICSQLHLGEGILWREMPWERQRLQVSPEVARGHLGAALPPNGIWYEGQRPHTAVWIPPGEGMPTDATPSRPAPVGAYLEISGLGTSSSACVGDIVQLEPGGKLFEVVAVHREVVTVRRRVVLPPDWQRATDNLSDCEYYHNLVTDKVQWEFPDLPRPWQAVTDPETSITYYHDTSTDVTRWDPPEFEELERRADQLEVKVVSPQRSEQSEATIWCRSFVRDRAVLEPMRKALATLSCRL